MTTATAGGQPLTALHWASFKESSPFMDPQTAAYYQGMADYEAALTGGYGYSEIEAAYQQGMTDYEAALAQQYGYTGEEAAYYQGMADYEALATQASADPAAAAYFQGVADYHAALGY